jgi:starch phosphorylase
MNELHAAWKADRARPFTHPTIATQDNPIAFLCAEFGLIHDPARAIALLRGRRMQVVIAGRAHPQDEEAKQIVKAIFSLKDSVSTRVAFLEDYDLAVAHQLVAGCDVWVNLPRAPLEASGTSGMKAALNGGLNVSVLDGWWCEAFEDNNNNNNNNNSNNADPNDKGNDNNATGWGIASANEADDATQDRRDAETLFGLLEREVLPMFYQRDESGIPRKWVRRMKCSLRRVISDFTTKRMLDEYAERVWRRRAT